MCAYCNIGDQFSKWDPPFKEWPNVSPYIPKPIINPQEIKPWPIDKAKEYLDILKEIKALEDKVGCPCEPNKADYIKLLGDYVKKLKKEEKNNIKPVAKKKKRPGKLFADRNSDNGKHY